MTRTIRMAVYMTVIAAAGVFLAFELLQVSGIFPTT